MKLVALPTTPSNKTASRKRRLVILVAIVALLAVLLLIWHWSTDSLSTLDVFRIEKGMTREEVIEILGRRPETVVTLSPEGETTQIWEVSGGTILVRFDPQGVVKFRNISSERSYRPMNALQRFLRRLGI